MRRLFNQGSPYNHVAGESSIDLSKVIAHYEKKNKEIDAARISRMKDGKRSVYETD